MDEKAQERLDMAMALERLRMNPDFKKVIVSGYIDETALRTGSSFTGANDEILDLMAVSHLRRWMDGLTDDGKAIRDEFMNIESKDK